MANKLPNEAELFQKIHDEHLAVSSALWDLIYGGIEDKLTVIKLLLTLYLEANEAVPLNEVKKTFEHIRDVSLIFRQVIHPQIIKTEDKGFVKIKEESQSLPTVIRNLLSHYVGNDIQSINFILGDCLDDNRALEIPAVHKILCHVRAMEEFLTKLKLHTETLEERVKNLLTLPLVYLNNLKSELNAEQAARVEKSISSLQEIDGILRKK